ncbi:MAG TPA: ATP-binding protein [Thermoanaerobaculia bacterium]|nr:ATP-binding protein [Thermoanaerobaculia bacterium]
MSAETLQALISRSALEWRLTFDALEFPLLLLEMDGSISRMNEAARALAGVTFEEAIHQRLEVLGDGQPWRTVLQLLAQAVASGERAGLQTREEHGRVWDVALSPAAGPDGHHWWVVVIHDVSERVRLEESLRRSETMSAMGALVAGVAHEVRNPLFGISATLDAFESRFKRRTEYRRYLDVLKERVGRLNELMQHLLDYGKPARLELAPAAPRQVMGAAVVACAPLAVRAGIELVLDVPSELPPLLLDRNRVVQIFQNLLENSIQHSPAGGRVTFRAEPTEDGTAMRFTVEDGGPGFRPEDLGRAFEPFFTRRRGGTGLGLSIVQRMAEQHGGEVAAANRPQGGALMTVTLPLSPGAPGAGGLNPDGWRGRMDGRNSERPKEEERPASPRDGPPP